MTHAKLDYLAAHQWFSLALDLHVASLSENTARAVIDASNALDRARLALTLEALKPTMDAVRARSEARAAKARRT